MSTLPVRLAGYDADWQDKEEQTALMQACGAGQPEVVDALLQGGAKCDLQDAHGRTALLNAALRHETNRTPSTQLKVSALVECRANANLQDKHGLSPLMVLARCGDAQAVLALIDKAAPLSSLALQLEGPRARARAPHRFGGGGAAALELGDGKEWTALMWAVEHGRLPAAQSLALHGASLSAPDHAGRSPLHAAVGRENKVMAEWLLRSGADPDLLDANGHSPLLLAARAASPPLVKLLTSHRADPNLAEVETGETALMAAARLGSEKMVRVLLYSGAQGRPTRRGRTRRTWRWGRTGWSRGCRSCWTPPRWRGRWRSGARGRRRSGRRGGRSGGGAGGAAGAGGGAGGAPGQGRRPPAPAPPRPRKRPPLRPHSQRQRRGRREADAEQRAQAGGVGGVGGVRVGGGAGLGLLGAPRRARRPPQPPRRRR